MESVKLTEALGYTVGDRLMISAEAFDTRVARTTTLRVLVAWPWREVDEESANSWDGTMGFSRDPDAYDWGNTPWRLEPDPSTLRAGDPCFVGIPPTEVKITGIEKYEPPADFGFLPRPDHVLEVVPVDLLSDDDAGYVLYLNGHEPIDIHVLDSRR
ncbi:hypothetical protein Ade02nite_84880 [Paractinoplanes deccanensis]|uniref:Uncharacterized protein n=1 Tax=Paractinoplanes deccanensis TaxID=113561 RepID=A0ABQ3YIQ0_9ACTN|nr:hypothetical protein [Actinoplanes deccanensis]GID79847.1 hypothetical protein Ade02nite_84880 [Actinoplanes deccanensis]